MKRVFVGLSGGVDSATSAALLKERGYDATGVFIKIWAPEFLECTWRADRLDAMRAAAAIGIPFREIDLSGEYKREVVDAMVSDYARGITPNPDVLCNERIKFGAFMRWALSEGADYVATGHYARLEAQPRGSTSLLRGRDIAKDQSYFLHRISGDDLRRVIFPIGDLPKARVREEAARFRLPMARKPDSQGLCFVGEVSMADFLRRFIKVEKGSVVDGRGNVIGAHDGAALYTIGQRHGFVIAGKEAQESHYIVAISTETNMITVSKDKNDAARTEITVRDIHWINDAPSLPLSISVQTRYHEASTKCTLREEGEAVTACFESPHIVSPGQSIVFYDGDVCLGGAIIA